MEVDGKSRVITITPVLSLIAYSAGDQLGTPIKLANLFDTSGDTAALQTISVLDKAKQSPAIDILLFDALPTVVSSDNAPLDISSVEMADKFIGRITLPSTSYSQLVNNGIGVLNNIGLLVESRGNTSVDVYCVLQVQSGPTFASASDLVIKIGVFQD